MKSDQNGHDVATLQAVFQRLEAPLVRYATRLIGDAERGRDIVQDTFLRLCREDPKPSNEQISPWLYRVCRNRAFDVRKKERRMTSLSTETAASEMAGPAATAERKESADLACLLLRKLPENQREVIRLKIEHGLSYREISEVTGFSISNVGYLLHHGLKSLRQRLANHQPGQNAKTKAP